MVNEFFMRGDQLLRKITCTLLITLCVFASAMTQTPSQPSPEHQPATFEERLGEDDGAALAILISANERGSLEVCD
jgi:hypothetical protein